jgi:hypothetical protein
MRPCIFAETRLRRLRKRPQRKSLCALQRFGMKIAVTSSLNGIPSTSPYSLRLSPVSRTIGSNPATNRILTLPALSMASPLQCSLPRFRPTQSRIIHHNCNVRDSLHLENGRRLLVLWEFYGLWAYFTKSHEPSHIVIRPDTDQGQRLSGLKNARKMAAALNAIVDTINATGGVVPDSSGFAPAADEEWLDLGVAYALACEALGMTRLVVIAT